MSESDGGQANGVLYVLALVYLLFDYVRPQDTIPGLGAIRPAMVVTGALALLLFAKRDQWLRSNFQQRALWAFTGLLAVHVPFARNNRYAFDAFLGMLLNVPFVLALPLVITSYRRLRGFLAVCLIFMAYQSLFAVFHGGKGTGSSFIDENDLALFVNCYLPIAYFGFITERRAVAKVFPMVPLLLGLAGNVVAMSRGGFVGLLAAGFVAWLFSPRKLLSLLIIVVVGVGLVQLAGDAYWKEMATVTDAEDGTGRERVESWKSGWTMFLHNPQGVGGGNFAVRFEEYQTDYFERGMWGRAAHSLWVSLMTELGVPGMIIFLLLLIRNTRDCLQIRRIGSRLAGDQGLFLRGVGSALLASIAGFLASGTFLSVLYYPHYWYLTGLVTATRRLASTLEPADVVVPLS